MQSYKDIAQKMILPRPFQFQNDIKNLAGCQNPFSHWEKDSLFFPLSFQICWNYNWYWWIWTFSSIPSEVWIFPRWQEHYLCRPPKWRGYQGWWIWGKRIFQPSHLLWCHHGNDGSSHQQVIKLRPKAWLWLQEIKIVEYTCGRFGQFLTIWLLGFQAKQDNGLLGRIITRYIPTTTTVKPYEKLYFEI